MNKKIIICVLIVILFISAIVITIVARNGEKENLSTDLGENVVQNDITAELDELELRGDKFSGISEAGKPMIILYCNPKEESSMEAVKMLQNCYANYQEKVTFRVIVAMDNEEEKGSADSFIAENNIEIPVTYELVIDSESTANEISNVPTLLMVNKRGEKINSLIDHITEDAINANLDILTENY